MSTTSTLEASPPAATTLSTAAARQSAIASSRPVLVERVHALHLAADLGDGGPDGVGDLGVLGPQHA